MLSGGVSLGSSTFISSSSWTGGLPDRKQILEELALSQKFGEGNLLFVQHVRNPEYASPLLHLGGVEAKVGALLVKADTVRKSHGSGNEEVGGLRVRCP